MADDQVIDIRRYLGETPETQGLGAFAVWGGGGERSRFALPLWRAIYLVGGNWGGIVSLPKALSGEVVEGGGEGEGEGGGDGGASPLFILDLKQDPARTVCPAEALLLLQNEEVPALVFTGEKELAVFLGEDEERRWFLMVQGGTSKRAPEGKARETLLFLAGECAGLLFFRELAGSLTE